MESKQRDNFVFFRSFFEAIDEVDTDTQLSLYRAIAVYALNGVAPNLSGAAKAVFLMAKPVIDKNNEKYDNRRNRKNPGGAPKGNQNARKQPKTTKNNQKQTDVDVDVSSIEDIITDKISEIFVGNDGKSYVRQYGFEILLPDNYPEYPGPDHYWDQNNNQWRKGG